MATIKEKNKKTKVMPKKHTNINLKSKVHEELDYYAKLINNSR